MSYIAVGDLSSPEIFADADVNNHVSLALSSAEHSALSFTPTDKHTATAANTTAAYNDGSGGVGALIQQGCVINNSPLVEQASLLNTVTSATSQCDDHQGSVVLQDAPNGFLPVQSSSGHQPSAPPGMISATICAPYHPHLMPPAAAVYNWPPMCGVLPPGFTPATLPFVGAAQMPYPSLPVYPYGYPMMPAPGSWPMIPPSFHLSPPIDQHSTSFSKVDWNVGWACALNLMLVYRIGRVTGCWFVAGKLLCTFVLLTCMMHRLLCWQPTVIDKCCSDVITHM